MLLGLLIAILLIGGWVMSSYNSLVNLEENVDQKFSAVEVQYQRRFDLIPNIVKTVEGSANFEKSTLQGVVEARSAWAKPGATPSDKIAAAGAFDSAISRLLVTVESYPDIKSTQAFRDLTVELEGTENRVAFARNDYNETATSYNKSVRMFPRNLLVGALGFDAEKTLFAAATGAEKAPAVNFEIK